jgi:hypothetical protein
MQDYFNNSSNGGFAMEPLIEKIKHTDTNLPHLDPLHDQRTGVSSRPRLIAPQRQKARIVLVGVEDLWVTLRSLVASL